MNVRRVAIPAAFLAVAAAVTVAIPAAIDRVTGPDDGDHDAQMCAVALGEGYDAAAARYCD